MELFQILTQAVRRISRITLKIYNNVVSGMSLRTVKFWQESLSERSVLFRIRSIVLAENFEV